MKLHPLGDRVVIILEKTNEMTAGGIALPQNAQEKTHFGKVVAVGPGKRNDAGELIKMEVNVDDIVAIGGRWSGEDLTIDGIEYKIVSSSDILGIIKE